MRIRVLIVLLIVFLLAGCSPVEDITPAVEEENERVNLVEVYDINAAASLEIFQLNLDASQEGYVLLLETQDPEILSDLAQALDQNVELQPDTFCLAEYTMKIFFLDGKQAEIELLECDTAQMSARISLADYEGWQVPLSENFQEFFSTLLAENAEDQPETEADGLGNPIEEYNLTASSRIILSELSLSSGEEQSSSTYQPLLDLEDPQTIDRLVSSLDTELESQAVARCPVLGRFSFYAAENLLYEMGVGCTLEDPFFLADLQSGRQYALPAGFEALLQELLAQAEEDN